VTENKYSAPKASLGDHAIGAAKVIGSAVPIFGGPGVELFNWLISPPLERRRQSWMEEVGSKLAELEKRTGVNLDELQTDDRFLDTVLKASQAAIRTSQEEKRAALRNAVLRSAMPHAPQIPHDRIFYGELAFLVQCLALLDLDHCTGMPRAFSSLAI